MVASLKLQSGWGPAPSPVELPKASRMGQCAEAAFFIVHRPAAPAGLFADEPEGSDDLRFSEARLERHGRSMLLAPLPRDEAKRRHTAREDDRLTATPQKLRSRRSI